MMKSVSVIIPAYNAIATISRAIESVFEQGDYIAEIIVVDDGSTDGTADFVNEHFKKQVLVSRQANAGPAAARNHGIGLSQGKYIAFLDADDEWLPGKIALQLETFRAYPEVGMCFTDMEHWENERLIHASYLHEKAYKYITSGWIYRHLLQECFIFTPTVMVKRAVFEGVQWFDESLRIAEDYDLWLRIAAKYQIFFLDKPLLRRFRHGSNITADKRLYLEASVRMLNALLERERHDRKNIGIVKRRLAEACMNAGYHFRESGERGKAINNYFMSLRMRPCLASCWGLTTSLLPFNTFVLIRELFSKLNGKMT